MTNEKLFEMAVTLTQGLIQNGNIGPALANPEEAVYDRVIGFHQALREAWLDITEELYPGENVPGEPTKEPGEHEAE